MPFDLIAERQTGIVVLSTVVPTSFAAVDSLDKTRFRFIARHPGLFVQGAVPKIAVRKTKPKSEYNNFLSIVVLLGTRTQYHRGKQAKEGVR